MFGYKNGLHIIWIIFLRQQHRFLNFLVLNFHIYRMHLVAKSFGKQQTQNNSTSSSLSSKGGYFSSLKLGSDEKQTKVPQKKEKRKGPPKGFIPQKFGLAFDPPTIVLQYLDPQNSKRYHHKMPIKKLKKDTVNKDALQYLKKSHHQYFSPKVIDQTQIEKLIDKLKMGLMEGKSQMGEVQQEDFDFDYDDDFEDV